MALLQYVNGLYDSPSFYRVTYRRNVSFTVTKLDAMSPKKLKIKLNALLLTHMDILKEIDICEPTVVPVLKNIECPITYNNITSDFIECPVCKTCYDYSDEKVNQWFLSRKKCCICRATVNTAAKNIQGYNTIVYKLKQGINDNNNYNDSDSDNDNDN
jgi:hypothetical protein